MGGAPPGKGTAMREFFRTMVRHLEAGEPVILVSLLASSGSTPRGAGAMMACYPGGSAGTIGGGNVEFTAQNLAKELLASHENALRSYRFTPGDAASLGMVCGGDVTVHFQYLDPADTAAVAALRRLVELSGGQGLWLLRRLEGEKVTETRALTEGEAPELAAYLKDATLFQDGILTIPVSRPGTVWLFGGGHVSQALAAVLAPLDFRVAVYDGKAGGRPLRGAAPSRPPGAGRLPRHHDPGPPGGFRGPAGNSAGPRPLSWLHRLPPEAGPL